MSSRVSFLIAVIIMLGATLLRTNDLTTFPAGYTDEEINSIRIIEAAREGNIEVFYNIGNEGHEGVYYITQALVTTLTGKGTLGYRILSVWMSLICLATTYALGRRIFGEIAGLSAMAILAVMFTPLVFARQISPLMVLPTVSSTVLLLLSMNMPTYRRRWQRGDNTIIAAALGFFLGIGIYIHPAGLFILLTSLIFIMYMLRSRRSMSRRRLSYIGFSLLILIIMSVPYIISTIRRPQLGGLDRLGGAETGDIFQNLINSIGGLVGMGDANAWVNIPMRPLLDPISAVFVFIGIGVAIWGRRQPRYALLLIATAILSPIYLFSSNAPNFDNVTTLLPLIATYFGLGVYMTIHYMPEKWHQQVAGIGIMVLMLWNGATTYNDFFSQWAKTPEIQQAYSTRLGQLATYVDRGGDKPMVICGFQVGQSPSAPTLSDSQILNLYLHRTDRTALRYVDCTRAFVMINGGEYQEVIIPDTTIFDTADEEIKSWLFQLRPIDAPNLPLDGVFAFEAEDKKLLEDKLGLLVGEPGPRVIFAPSGDMPRSNPVTTPISFGGNLTLLTYILDPNANGIYRPSQTVRVITYWRTQGTVPPDLRLFTHVLIDPGARPPANTDILNLQARFLQERDVFVQATNVILPNNFPVGEYILSIGGYQDTSGIRLDVLDNGIPRTTSLFLDTITVIAE
ncbi:MAG: glycosyltransferase family 39 protein [Anaerolineae bacterium]|nr:glycosyltransferase family 39 protein [Anaerolineae bacterium]